MAGHNKWSKIKHRKAAVEKKKTKAWTKVAKALMVASRNGGPDPDTNLTLRYAIDEARYANMPRDTIERAIKKGSGEKDDRHYESIRYEGYGPAGAAIIIDALTDNRTRTVGDVRLAFSKCGGNVGNSGCVAYMFEARGQILVSADGASEDNVMEAAIAAGADDVLAPDDPTSDDEPWTILTPPTSFQIVKEGLEKAGLKIAEAQIAMIPTNRVTARGEVAQSLIDLVDALEDLDDVQRVYSNFDIPDDELAAMGG